MTAEAGRLAFGDLASGVSPDGLEQYKLDRLLELRAVIDSLRAERSDESMAGLTAGLDRAAAV